MHGRASLIHKLLPPLAPAALELHNALLLPLAQMPLLLPLPLKYGTHATHVTRGTCRELLKPGKSVRHSCHSKQFCHHKLLVFFSPGTAKAQTFKQGEITIPYTLII